MENVPSLQEINSITFGIYSPEEIISFSTCKIDNPKKEGYGSVYDFRMGSLDDSKCETCNLIEECPGHFGYIQLNEYILHPLYYKRIENILKCFCIKCFKLLITYEYLELHDILKFKGESRFQKILDICSRNNSCMHCEKEQPSYKFNTTDNNMYIVYIVKKNKSEIPFSVDEIKTLLDNVSNRDIELCGFNPKLIHPRNLILSIIPVIPICDRPFVKADNNICDDDLTIQYCDIIKINNELLEEGINETKKQKLLNGLKFKVFTLFNNSQQKAKISQSNRPIKGIKERICGKEGQLRNNLLGKRCEQTARTVIGPDPCLKLNEVAIPVEIADILTVPVKVNKLNYEYMSNLVNSGKANFVFKNGSKVARNLTKYINKQGTKLLSGDIIIRNGKRIHVKNGKEILNIGDLIERNGNILDKIEYPGKRYYKLEIGDIVERKLQNGDYIILNRQPTLHSGSMEGMKVVIKSHKTIRFNLAICKQFNSDFDGDEMNIHVAQGLEAQAELKYLSSAQYKIITAQSSKPLSVIVQDSLLASYKMTLLKDKLTKSQFFDIVSNLEMSTQDILKKIQHIRRILKEKGKPIHCFNGKGLISMFLPNDFNYEKKNNTSEEEPIVKIYRGVLYEGVFDKNIIGSSHGSIIQLLYKEYSPEEAAKFIDNIQIITRAWLFIYSFSIGLKDCLIPNSKNMAKEEIQNNIQKCLIEADSISITTKHNGIKEARINAALNKAKDIGMRIAKDAFLPDNNFISTVKSGSKGDFFNIAQITGIVGQQNIKGKRIAKILNNGNRTIHHYPYKSQTTEMEYESRGFISSSFINGLNPREFYMHHTAARDNVIDTALGTATTGYIQRRIIKLTEDIKICYDNTVRDATNRTFQYNYNEIGYDPIMTVKVGNDMDICDISRLVDKINLKHDLSFHKKMVKT